jgi:hypothetical protein
MIWRVGATPTPGSDDNLIHTQEAHMLGGIFGGGGGNGGIGGLFGGGGPLGFLKNLFSPDGIVSKLKGLFSGGAEGSTGGGPLDFLKKLDPMALLQGLLGGINARRL